MPTLIFNRRKTCPIPDSQPVKHPNGHTLFDRTPPKVLTVPTAIFLTESRPPAGEAPVEWLLLSSQPVTTLAAAVETVKWYLCRWEVEVYFRIYKSGCRVERLQLEISEHLEPALALYMIIAWRIQSIVMLGRAYPDLPCDVVFDDLEWRTAFVIRHHRPPTTPPRLADMITIIASFGGYLARNPPPGPKAI